MTSDSKTTATVPRWYQVVAIASLLWNLLGCASFGLQVFAQETMLESATEAVQQWYRSIPGWIYFVFAVAVASGVAGSMGLILRKGWSVASLAVSLAAVLIQMGYSYVIAGGLQVMGPADLVIPGAVTVVAIALFWFSRFARGAGWLVD
ncbi:MAG: hypothetical protein CMJ59_23915 [Planctomycetaceae bacterium]|nr:hypothetical protein [Planctomycetaceae bacterium]